MADGRRVRREQNREAVLDAMVELFEEGSYQPTTDEIAQRAGISPRSLFRYFIDSEDLSRAVIDRELVTSQPLLELTVVDDAPLDERIRSLVEARVRLYETIAPTARAARLAATRNPTIAKQLRERRALLRGQVRRVLDPEAAMLPALDALCSFETYELLRHDQRLSKLKAAEALVVSLRALVGVAA
jgi:AcrR family transcriptional regulator